MHDYGDGEKTLMSRDPISMMKDYFLAFVFCFYVFVYRLICVVIVSVPVILYRMCAHQL